MSSPHQAASFRRKMIYAGSILALFVATLFVRGLLWITPETYAMSIQGQAEELEGTERAQGKTELAGSAIRLLLTGSRGFAVTILWINAQEKQKNNQWNDLEVLVDSINQLQPHFIVPWTFQSWNLAYNVSVEMDRLSDMYFYISRGILVIARGETVNARNPDLRRTTGFYYTNKFGVSDMVKTLRCLFQLSCMEQEKRNPNRLLDSNRELNVAEFETFCRENPQLVRRLREKLGYQTPSEILQFLKDNEKVPTRYQDDGKLADRLRQFPVLPETRQRETDKEIDILRQNYDSDIQSHLPTNDSNADGYEAGATWYHFALEVVPPGEGRPAATPTPSARPNPEDDEYDPKLYRVPRAPMLVLFRQDYPRAKTSVAERFLQEGWFDRDTPWLVDEGIPPVSDPNESRLLRTRWFDKEVAIYPTDTGSAAQSWRKVYDLWKAHGDAYGLQKDSNWREERTRTAKLYADRKGFQVGISMPPEPNAEERQDPVLMDSYRAARQLVIYAQNLQVTNYNAWRDSSYAESGEKESGREPLLLRAHKKTFQADQFRRLKARDSRARELYEEALATWIKVFEEYPRLHDSDLERYQEAAYQANLYYLRIVRLDNQLARRQASVALSDLMRRATPTSPLNMFDLMSLPTMDQTFSRVEPLAVMGPLDGDDPKTGQPYIDTQVKDRVRERLGELRAKPPADAPSAPSPNP